MTFRLLRTIAMLAALVGILGCPGCGGSDTDQNASAEPATITTAKPVADAFDADRGKARLVLLLSPT